MGKINSYYHAVSSAKKWGGTPEEYVEIHEFIDSSKKIIGDVRHRAMYHHTEGIWLCQKIFGRTITVDKEGKHPREVPVRLIAELHVEQDLGWIPSPADYLKDLPLGPKSWYGGPIRKERNISDVFPGVRGPEEFIAKEQGVCRHDRPECVCFIPTTNEAEHEFNIFCRCKDCFAKLVPPKDPPPPVPLVPDPNLLTEVITSGSKVPKKKVYDKVCCCCGDYAMSNGYCGPSGCTNRPA